MTTANITPFLWFDDKAEEAIAFYTSVFPRSTVIESHRRGPGGPLSSATFELDGQRFIALNGGPHYKFSPAVSFLVSCETQEEIDAYWDKLAEGGEPLRCGWVTDRYGLTWQIIPRALPALLAHADRGGAVMEAMLKMVKLDVAALEAAARG